MPRFPNQSLRRLRQWIFSAALLAAGSAVAAPDSRPIVGPGATKDDVINAYGWPNGQSQSGTKEIFNYAQGSVTLDNGRVERVDFLPNVPWQTPKPRPGATSAAPAATKAATVGFDPWTTSFPDAAARAEKQHARILALFTGSDWSPPSKKFLEEVATHPDFVNPLLTDFIFLKVDFPTRVALSAELKKQNEDLRARCGVTTYPSLVVLAPGGEPVATVDLSKGAADGDYRAAVIAAVAEVRDLLKTKTRAVETLPPAPGPTPAPAPAPILPAPMPSSKPAAASAETNLLGAVVSSARWNILLGLGGGALIAAALMWWLWRGLRMVPNTTVESGNVFSGLGLGNVPTEAELSTWPVERVRALAAGIFEEAGHKATMRADTNAEFTLAAPDATKPAVLVFCWSATAGPAHAKAMRALSGNLVADEIAQGWFVSPSGFYDEARAVAQERGIVLIDGADLIAQLKQLQALALRRVLARAEASRPPA